MKTKKSQVSSTLVLLVAAMLALLVLLYVTGAFGKLLESVVGKSTCEMQFIISSIAKNKGVFELDPECEPHLITVTPVDLDKGRILAKNTLEKYKDNDLFQNYYDYYVPNSGQINENKLNEWAMNKIIAKEMKSCWDITGRGKLDLFSDWGIIMCYDEEGNNEHECSKEDIEKIYSENKELSVASGLIASVVAYRIPIVGGFISLPAGLATSAAAPMILEGIKGNIEHKSAPTFCVLCARIKLDEEAKKSFNYEITSMGDWLANNPTSELGLGSKISYAQYLENDAFKGLFSSIHSYPYNPEKTYAVLYTRVNTFGIKEYYDDFFKDVPKSSEEEVKDIQTIQLVEYQSIKEKCTVLIG